MKRSTILWLLLLALLLAAGGYWWYSRQGQVVELVAVTRGEIAHEVADTGYVQAVSEISVYSPQSARVSKVLVKIGDQVTVGQTLVLMENLDLKVQVSEIRSQLAQAEANATAMAAGVANLQAQVQEAEDAVARMAIMYPEGIVAEADYKRAQLQADGLRAALSEQEARLASAQAMIAGLESTLLDLRSKQSELKVTSPLEGVILRLPAEPEQVLMSGALLATVGGLERLEVRVDILSDDLAEIRIGQRALITAPFLGNRTVVGTVSEIYPRAEEKTSALGVIQRRVAVILDIPEPAGLKPGFEVRAAIETVRNSDVLLIPRESIRLGAEGEATVMVVSQGLVEHRLIKVGISDAERIQVLEGLQLDEQIVREASLDLPAGSKVRVQ